MEHFYAACMRLGKISGCHQIPERSFFLHGKQFPVCARCTGVFLGQVFGWLSFYWVKPSILFLATCFAAMLLDWLIQAFGWLESNNSRRLVTGTMCGYAIGNLSLNILKILICL